MSAPERFREPYAPGEWEKTNQKTGEVAHGFNRGVTTALALAQDFIAAQIRFGGLDALTPGHCERAYDVAVTLSEIDAKRVAASYSKRA